MNSNISPIDLLSLVKDIKLSGYAVLSYFVFSPREEVWISYKRLKDETTLGVHTLMQVVSLLEGLGILSVQRFPQGSGEVNRYKVNFLFLQSLIEERKAKTEAKRDLSKSNLFSTLSDSPTALLSDSLSDPAKPPATPSGLHDSGEPAEPFIDRQYLTLAQQVRDGQVKPALLKWLRDTRMILPSGELDLDRLVTTFPNFQDFCSGYEQQVTENNNIKNETCSMIDGLNVVQFPTKHDSNADLIKDLAKHFDSKGV